MDFKVDQEPWNIIRHLGSYESETSPHICEETYEAEQEGEESDVFDVEMKPEFSCCILCTQETVTNLSDNNCPDLNFYKLCRFFQFEEVLQKIDRSELENFDAPLCYSCFEMSSKIFELSRKLKELRSSLYNLKISIIRIVKNSCRVEIQGFDFNNSSHFNDLYYHEKVKTIRSQICKDFESKKSMDAKKRKDTVQTVQSILSSNPVISIRRIKLPKLTTGIMKPQNYCTFDIKKERCNDIGVSSDNQEVAEDFEQFSGSGDECYDTNYVDDGSDTDFNSQCSDGNCEVKSEEEVTNSEFTERKLNRLLGRRKSKRCRVKKVSPKYEAHNSDVVLKNSERKMYPCSYCGETFTKFKERKKHMFNAHEDIMAKLSKGPKKPCKLPCSHCDRKFRNASELAVHERKHTGETPFKCDHCDIGSVSKIYLERHIERCHPEIPPLRCSICQKGFFREYRLKSHIIVHSGERSYLCEYCPKSFSQQAFLMYHRIACHAEIIGSDPYECEECGKSFATPVNLKQHKQTQHKKQFRFRCEICGVGAPHHSTLKKHMLIHSDVRPFVCNICGKSYRRISDLNSHMKSHQNNREYVCKSCGSSFNRKSHLTRHEKIHSRNHTLVAKAAESKLIHCENTK